MLNGVSWCFILCRDRPISGTITCFQKIPEKSKSACSEPFKLIRSLLQDKTFKKQIQKRGGFEHFFAPGFSFLTAAHPF
jgi:hypothetical protein